MDWQKELSSINFKKALRQLRWWLFIASLALIACLILITPNEIDKFQTAARLQPTQGLIESFSIERVNVVEDGANNTPGALRPYLEVNFRAAYMWNDKPYETTVFSLANGNLFPENAVAASTAYAINAPKEPIKLITLWVDPKSPSKAFATNDYSKSSIVIWVILLVVSLAALVAAKSGFKYAASI